MGAAGVFGVEDVAGGGEEQPLLNKGALTRLDSRCRAHLFTTQFPCTNSATCWMQRSAAVESVPEASRPIRLANWITLTARQRKAGRTQHQWGEPAGLQMWSCWGTLPFFIRVLTCSTRGSVRSWAMDSTLLGPTGFTLSREEGRR